MPIVPKFKRVDSGLSCSLDNMEDNDEIAEEETHEIPENGDVFLDALDGLDQASPMCRATDLTGTVDLHNCKLNKFSWYRCYVNAFGWMCRYMRNLLMSNKYLAPTLT